MPSRASKRRTGPTRARCAEKSPNWAICNGIFPPVARRPMEILSAPGGRFTQGDGDGWSRLVVAAGGEPPRSDQNCRALTDRCPLMTGPSAACSVAYTMSLPSGATYAPPAASRLQLPPQSTWRLATFVSMA